MIEYGPSSQESIYKSPLRETNPYPKYGEDFEEDDDFEQQDPYKRDPNEIDLEQEVKEDQECDSDWE